MAIDFRSIAEFADRDPDFYWSRTPGRFVSATTGNQVNGEFFDTVRDWYETLSTGIFSLMPEGTILLAGFMPCLILDHCIGFSPVAHDGVTATYRGALYGRIEIHQIFTIPDDRFILIKMIDDTIIDTKVGIILP